MRYTVTWIPTAEAELANIWNHASDQQAIADASDQIDLLLANDPHKKGEEFGDDRILRVWPLVVVYAVYPDDCLAEVLDVARL